MFELLAEDALGLQTQAIAIEAQRFFQIIDAQGDDADAWLYALVLFKPDACILMPAAEIRFSK